MAEIGSTLREARMRARIDISEVEARTKIRAKYLRALENEEWDLLPGDIYVKSFLRTYGDFLGLDSRLLIDEFKRRYERPSDHEARPINTISTRDRDRSPRGQRSQRGQRSPQRRMPGLVRSQWVAVIAVLAVIVVVLYLVGSHVGKQSPSTTAGTSTLTTGKHSTAHKKHHAKKSNTATTTTPVVPTKATLGIVPTGAIYVCVERPNGKILIPGVTYSAGETVPPVSGKELLVTFGNTNATVKVDGAAYTLTAPDPVALEITPTGAKRIATGPTCAG